MGASSCFSLSCMYILCTGGCKKPLRATSPICASLAEDVTEQTRAAVQWLSSAPYVFHIRTQNLRRQIVFSFEATYYATKAHAGDEKERATTDEKCAMK